MSDSALRLQIGARTIASIPRRLVRVGLSLEQALGGAMPPLPPLGHDHGYLVTSLPEAIVPDWRGVLFERQRYTRYYVDLAAGEAAWRAGLSGQTRSTLKRKAKKLAAASGRRLDVRRFRTPAALVDFHPIARALAEKTYQEKLMAAGLPGDVGFVQRMMAMAGADQVRAWLLFIGDVPAAYLWCGADGTTLRYDYVGHDPAFAALSPGSVLMEAALGDLFSDRFARFDFTEGEGQHKRGLASAGVACRDLLLLRPTLANRGAVALVGGFDAAMRVAKRAAEMPALRGVARRVRRA
ncbi:GNAT family N-acetyltransferase [Sphingomonas radiodurans]|uniref:GNAT family N-acetyltransferase n=1 Tax=Sphingomonas radiodurans TaxID=2890321 RepID=UPI001E4BCD82|nr:GNAT family N-acetyltransferase [Sphingomonas radiodurans]WBH17486.1 GNAT family N-acetyltransferase [Sphingomonas radiodurans]